MKLLSEPGQVTDEADGIWIAQWLDAVAAGSATMSQRARSSIDAHGGIEPVIAAAKARGVHLLQLTDDRGKVLVAASRDAFETLC